MTVAIFQAQTEKMLDSLSPSQHDFNPVMQVVPVFQGLRSAELDRSTETTQRCESVANPTPAAAHPATESITSEIAQPVTINQASDLNVILQERDACGVCDSIT